MHVESIDDDGRSFFALLSSEKQHSLSPRLVDGPADWQEISGKASRAACLDHVERNWPDIRSKSLREKLAQPSF
jgi:MbtH protein